MKTSNLGTAAVVLTLGMFAFDAAAVDGASPVGPGEAYVDLGLGLQYFGGPEWSYGQDTNGKADRVLDTDAAGVGIRGELGIVFEPGTFSGPFGANTRLEGAVGYGRASTKTSGTIDVGSQLPLLDGTFNPATGTTPTAVASFPSRTELVTQMFELDLRLRTDYAAGPVTVTPYAGVNYRRWTQNYNYADFPVVPNVPATIGEDVEANLIGIGGGADVSAQVMQNTTAFIGGGLYYVYGSADLDANQTIFNIGGAGSNLTVRASDSISDNGFRALAALGVVHNLGWIRIGVRGHAEYWSFLPEVVNPRVGGTRVTLDNDNAFTFTGMAFVTIPIQ